MPDDRLIVGLDLPHAPAALELVERLGSRAVFYKIGLGMLTTSGLAVANELKAQCDMGLYRHERRRADICPPPPRHRPTAPPADKCPPYPHPTVTPAAAGTAVVARRSFRRRPDPGGASGGSSCASDRGSPSRSRRSSSPSPFPAAVAAPSASGSAAPAAGRAGPAADTGAARAAGMAGDMARPPPGSAVSGSPRSPLARVDGRQLTRQGHHARGAWAARRLGWR